MNFRSVARASFIAGALIGAVIDDCHAQGVATSAAATAQVPSAPQTAGMGTTPIAVNSGPAPATASAPPTGVAPAAQSSALQSGAAPALNQRFIVVNTALPRSLPYDGGPAPQGYVLQHRTSKVLWVTGGVTLLVSWLGTALAGAAAGVDLTIPLAGPWIDLAGPGRSPQRRTVDALSGGIQAVGAGMVVAGLLIDDPRFVRADLAGVRVGPMFGSNMTGAQLSTEF